MDSPRLFRSPAVLESCFADMRSPSTSIGSRQIAGGSEMAGQPQGPRFAEAITSRGPLFSTVRDRNRGRNAMKRRRNRQDRCGRRRQSERRGKFSVFAKPQNLTSGEVDLGFIVEAGRESVSLCGNGRFVGRTPWELEAFVSTSCPFWASSCSRSKGLQASHPRQRQTGRKAGAQSQGPAGFSRPAAWLPKG